MKIPALDVLERKQLEERGKVFAKLRIRCLWVEPCRFV